VTLETLDPPLGVTVCSTSSATAHPYTLLNPFKYDFKSIFEEDIQNTSRRATSLEEGQKELKDGADQLRINQEQQGGMWVLNMCYTHCTGFSLGTNSSGSAAILAG
jgi:hypothetical protein